MAQIFPGRYTADIEGDFVVFLIGMRINRFLKVRKWWPVFTAMPPMLKAHEQHPDLGVLDTRRAFYYGVMLMFDMVCTIADTSTCK